jgi:DUF971 family protein
MRARVASVAIVTCAILGVMAPGAYASRGEHDDGHDNGQQGNTYNHACTTNDHALVGNVCVIVDDLPILGHVLTP